MEKSWNILLPQQPTQLSPTAQQVVYCMADGCMVFTDDGGQETKVGRVFCEQLTSDSTAQQARPSIEQSHYVAHLGDHKAFADKFNTCLLPHRSLGNRLVCISDGALWLKNYWQQNAPGAQLILDFWHVIDKLAGLSQRTLLQQKQSKQWLDQQHDLLLESRHEQVKTNIRQLAPTSKELQQECQKVIDYLEQNQFRMDYKAYLKEGLHWIRRG